MECFYFKESNLILFCIIIYWINKNIIKIINKDIITLKNNISTQTWNVFTFSKRIILVFSLFFNFSNFLLCY